VHVCEHHSTPFDFLADLYYERVENAIGFGSRGSGKTNIMAVLHAMNSGTKPGCETAQVGAVEAQAKKCYRYFKPLVKMAFPGQVLTMRLGDTEFNNGSRLEILAGTMNAVNSPHPHKASLDEFELTTWDIFQEFLNMAQSTTHIKAQNILTSTRKRAYGTMQQVLDMVAEDSSFKVYTWCVFEAAAPCPHTTCSQCKTIRKGGRSFFEVCRMRMKRSQGFIPWQDIVYKRFKTLDVSTWDAQQECKRPERTGLVFPWVSENPELGFVYERGETVWEAIDFGGTNPSVCLWIVERGKDIYIVDEIYQRSLAPSTFAEMIIAKRKNKGYNVPYSAYCDPAGKSTRLELAKWGIFTQAKASEVESRLQVINSYGEDGLLHLTAGAPNCHREFKFYHYPDPKQNKNLSEAPEKLDDHCPDAFGYYFIHRHMLGDAARAYMEYMEQEVERFGRIDPMTAMLEELTR